MKIDKSSPLFPPEYDDRVVHAFKAMARGDARDSQQKLVLDWIINQACKTYDLPYRPGEDGKRDTDFACGKAFVGQQIVKMLNFDVRKLTGEEDHDRSSQSGTSAGQSNAAARRSSAKRKPAGAA